MQLDLRTARKRRRLTITKLAQIVGVHKSTITRLEQGQTKPLADTADKIADALNYKRGSIVYGARPMAEAAAL